MNKTRVNSWFITVILLIYAVLDISRCLADRDHKNMAAETNICRYSSTSEAFNAVGRVCITCLLWQSSMCFLLKILILVRSLTTPVSNLSSLRGFTFAAAIYRALKRDSLLLVIEFCSFDYMLGSCRAIVATVTTYFLWYNNSTYCRDSESIFAWIVGTFLVRVGSMHCFFDLR